MHPAGHWFVEPGREPEIIGQTLPGTAMFGIEEDAACLGEMRGKVLGQFRRGGGSGGNLGATPGVSFPPGIPCGNSVGLKSVAVGLPACF